MEHEPKTGGIEFIAGGQAVDDRGSVGFCNDFDMGEVRRFYVVANHEPRFVRAWHAHKQETKYVFAACGAAILAAVGVDDWTAPDAAAEIHRFVLSDEKPGVLRIPSGFAHGSMTLKADTRLIFFSTSTVAESLEDDYRYPFDYWNPWNVLPR